MAQVEPAPQIEPQETPPQEPLSIAERLAALRSSVEKSVSEKEKKGEYAWGYTPLGKFAGKPEVTADPKAMMTALPSPEIQKRKLNQQEGTRREDDLQAFLGRVGKRRGVPVGAELLKQIVAEASRPATLEYGYDKNLFIYDPGKRAFDLDAMNAANIWAMRNLGIKYESPALLREHLKVDKDNREQEKLKSVERYAQQLSQHGGDSVIGEVDGELTEQVYLTKDADLNQQIAAGLSASAAQTLLLANFSPDTREALKGMSTADIPLEALTEAFQGDERAAKRVLKSAYSAREGGRPYEFIVPLLKAPDGYAVHAPKVHRITHGWHFIKLRARLETQENRRATKEELARLHEEADKFADEREEQMRNLGAAVYHADPTGAYKDLVEGRGIRGLASSALQMAVSVGSLGVDNLMGGLGSKNVKTAFGLTLPHQDVTGVVVRKGQKDVTVGQPGFLGHYLGDSATIRAADWALRLAMSEGVAAAYGIAAEDVIDKYGTVDGKGEEIAKIMSEVYGSDEHLFRISTRDDDMGTLMLTLGRAIDPTVLSGFAKESGTAATVIGALGMLAVMFFEPDAFTTLGPVGKAVKTASRGAKYLARLDNAAAIARGSEVLRLDIGEEALEGADLLRKAAEIALEDGAEGEKLLKEVSQQVLNEKTGALAAAWSWAQTRLLGETGVAGASGSNKSAIERYIRVNKRKDGRLETEIDRLTKKIDETGLPELVQATTDYENAARGLSHEQNVIQATSEAHAARELDLGESIWLINIGEDPTNLLRRFLSDALDAKAPDTGALTSEGVRQLLREAGLEPEAVLREAGRAAEMTKKQRNSFLTGLKGRLQGALTKSRDTLIEEARRTGQADLARFRQTIDQAQVNADAAEAARTAAESTLRNAVPRALHSDMEDVFAEVAKLQAKMKPAEVTLALRQVQLKALPELRKRKIAKMLNYMADLVEASEAFGTASAAIRKETGTVYARMVGKRIGDMAQDPELVAAVRQLGNEKQANKLFALFDVKSDKEILQLAADQRVMEVMFSSRHSLSQIVRKTNAARAFTWMELSRSGLGYYYTALANVSEFARLYSPFRLKNGVTDVQTTEDIALAAERAHRTERILSTEFDELVRYTTAGKGATAAEELAAKREAMRDFVVRPGVRTITTSVGKELQLSGQAFRSESIVDTVVEYIADISRVVGRKDYSDLDNVDAAFISLIKSLVADDQIKGADAVIMGILPKITNDIRTDVYGQLAGPAALDKMKEIIVKHLRAVDIDTVAGAYRSEVLFYKNLIGVAADQALVKSTANIIGPRFSYKMGRAANYYMSQGKDDAAVLLRDFKQDDFVVLVEEAKKFNEIFNYPMGKVAVDKDIIAGRRVEVAGKIPPPKQGTLDPYLKKGAEDLGMRRDILLEEFIRSENNGFSAYQIERFVDGKGNRVATREEAKYAILRDSTGAELPNPVELTELTLRDLSISHLDALDGLLMWGLDPILKGSEAIKETANTIRREYQHMILHSIDANGNTRMLPRDLNRRLYDRISKLEKNLTDAIPASIRQNPIARGLFGLLGKFMRFFKNTILFGFIVPKPSFITNTVVGDSTQMMLDLNMKEGLQLGLLGMWGYVPFVGPAIQRAALGARVGGAPGLPSLTGTMFNSPLRAILTGEATEIRRADGTLLKNEAGNDMTGAMLLQEAIEDGAGDYYMTIDAVRSLRTAAAKQFSANERTFSGLRLNAADFSKLLEQQVREGTRNQRVLLYSHLRVNKGFSRKEAQKLMEQALYNWDSASSAHEVALLGEFALFYTFFKNAIGQTHRAIFEGMDMGLDEYMRKFIGGRTKMQRLELMTRLASLRTEAVDPTQVLTPDEAEKMANERRFMNYMTEYTIFDFGTMTEEEKKFALRQGIKRENYAHVLPKATPVEMFQTYMNMINLTLVPATVAVLSQAGLTDQKVNTDALTRGLIAMATDQAGPVMGTLVEGAAEKAGFAEARPTSQFGKNVRVNEAAFLKFLGAAGALRRDERTEAFRINPDSQGGDGIVARIVSATGTPGRELERLFLPEFARARLVDEILTGGTLSSASADILGGLYGYTDDQIESMKDAPLSTMMGPMDAPLSKAERGSLAGRVNSLLKLLGGVTTFFYSGSQDKRWTVERQRKFADFSQNADKRRQHYITGREGTE